MLQDRLRLVLLNRLGHHVQDVVHNCRAELEIKVRFNALLRDRLGDSLRVTALELTGEQIPKPETIISIQYTLQLILAGTYQRSRRGTIPRMKNSQTRQPGAQNPQPGPFPTGPVLKR